MAARISPDETTWHEQTRWSGSEAAGAAPASSSESGTAPPDGPSVDHLTDLDRPRRTAFLLDLSLIGEAIELACRDDVLRPVNSVQIADAVRSGRLEAGLIALPINDDGLDVGAAVAEFSVVHATAAPEALAGPITIERLATCSLVLPEARWGDEDPTRRQLAERAQRAGVTVRPRIEVQHAGASLELAARGYGDTLVTTALLDVLGYRDRLTCRALDPPLQEIFAFIQRRHTRLPPATRALMTLAEEHLAALTEPARRRGHSP